MENIAKRLREITDNFWEDEQKRLAEIAEVQSEEEEEILRLIVELICDEAMLSAKDGHSELRFSVKDWGGISGDEIEYHNVFGRKFFVHYPYDRDGYWLGIINHMNGSLKRIADVSQGYVVADFRKKSFREKLNRRLHNLGFKGNVAASLYW